MTGARMKIFCWLILLLTTVPLFAARHTQRFRYDSSQPLNVEEKSVENHDGFALHDLRFNDVAGQSLSAYLIVPQGKGPFAGVLYVHWLGDPETSNRSQFLKEAEEMAPHGAVALLLDMHWSVPGWFGNRDMQEDYDFSIRQVQNLRRALDLLTRRPDVDPKRIAYVGHDFGATYGAILLGVDKRIHYAVLMAGTPILSDWFLLGAKVQGPERDAYIKKLSPLDPVNFLGEAKSVSLLLQFATHDRFIPKEKAELFANAAGEPKDFRWYDAQHALNDQAAADRTAWLETQLKLTMAPASN
jgi:dienelactone hydrolase